MAEIVHKIDPKADTIVVLENPLVDFAVWEPWEPSDRKKSNKSASKNGPVSYYVSSRHLILASKRFSTMLSGEQWKEGLRDQEDDLFHTKADGWDAEALLILMNVIHHQNRQVPKAVSLDMMAKIVVLVDFYECDEAMEVYTTL